MYDKKKIFWKSSFRKKNDVNDDDLLEQLLFWCLSSSHQKSPLSRKNSFPVHSSKTVLRLIDKKLHLFPLFLCPIYEMSNQVRKKSKTLYTIKSFLYQSNIELKQRNEKKQKSENTLQYQTTRPNFGTLFCEMLILLAGRTCEKCFLSSVFGPLSFISRDPLSRIIGTQL